MSKLSDIARWPFLHAALAHHRTTAGKTLAFSDRPWLRELYKDHSPQTVIQKASQLGITELALVKMFVYAQRQLRGMYILPTDRDAYEFVGDRINKLTDYSLEYRRALKRTVKETETKRFKQIYGSAWRFLGAENRKNFYSFPCSVLFIDEYDLQDEENLVYAQDRLGASEHQVIHRFGNPTFEDMGINKLYFASDRKEWEVQCHCGHYQVLDWFKHFLHDDQLIPDAPICEACGQPFNRLGPGQWIARQPDSKVSGYWVSKLFGDVRDCAIQELYERWCDVQGDPTKLQNFYNNWLGLPYTPKGEKLTYADLLACKATEDVGNVKAVCAGVDQGKDFHVHIGCRENGTPRKLWMGTCKTWEDLGLLLDSWKVQTCVIDAQGGGYNEVRQFCKDRKGVWMCYYNLQDRPGQSYVLDWPVIRCNRTESIDRAVALFKRREVIIPQDFKHVNGFVKQMCIPVRTILKGKPVWTRGVDHHFHAHNYCTLAIDLSRKGASAPMTPQQSLEIARQLNWG